MTGNDVRAAFLILNMLLDILAANMIVLIAYEAFAYLAR
jgi:hypothetical protein